MNLRCDGVGGGGGGWCRLEIVHCGGSNVSDPDPRGSDLNWLHWILIRIL
jgi:hypothetical protein